MIDVSLKNFRQRGEQSVVQTVMVALLIIAAFLIGMLWTKVQSIEGKGTGTAGGGSNVVADTGTAPAQKSAGKLDPITKDDWVRGNRSARFALVEYSDLECPFCKRFQETAIQFSQDPAYTDKVMWVYRHFPLDQLHSKARGEAVASECAAKLGGNDTASPRAFE